MPVFSWISRAAAIVTRSVSFEFARFDTRRDAQARDTTVDVDPNALVDARCVSIQADRRRFGCVPRLRVGLVFPEEKRGSATAKSASEVPSPHFAYRRKAIGACRAATRRSVPI